MLSNRTRIGIFALTGLALAACYFFYNLSILNRFLDHDIANYSVNVETRYLFNPHHLLFTTLSKVIYEIARERFDYDYPAMFLLQMLNLGAASLTIGFLFFCLALVGRRFWWAAVVTGLVAFSHGFWFYAHVNDTPAIPTCLAIVTFFTAIFLMRRFDPDRPWLDYIKAMALGALHCFAVGYHQKNVLLWVAIAMIILVGVRWPSRDPDGPEFFAARVKNDSVEPKRSLPRRFVFLGVYTTTVTLLVGAMYFWAGAVYHRYPLDNRRAALPGVPGGGNFYAWLFLYSHYSNNTWGNAKQPKTILALRGSTGAFFKNEKAFWRRLQNEIAFDEDRSPDIQIAATLGGLLVLFIASLPLLFMRLRILPVAALAWFGLYGGLATWWEPLHFEHWVNASVGFWVGVFCLGLGWLTLIERARLFHNAAYMLLVIGGASLAGLLWLTNYERTMLPQSRQIVFGHWEDFYLKSRFTGLLDGIVRERVIAIGENPERAWDKRVGRLGQFRAAMFATDAKGVFKNNRWRFEKTVQALEHMFPDRPEVARFRRELGAMHAGREAWLRYHGRSGSGDVPGDDGGAGANEVQNGDTNATDPSNEDRSQEESE